MPSGHYDRTKKKPETLRNYKLQIMCSLEELRSVGGAKNMSRILRDARDKATGKKQ